MWRRHGSNFNMDSEAYDIARGLYDCKGTQQIRKFYTLVTVLAYVLARLKVNNLKTMLTK